MGCGGSKSTKTKDTNAKPSEARPPAKQQEPADDKPNGDAGSKEPTVVAPAPPEKPRDLLDEFRKQVLAVHNEYRAKHHAQSLTIDPVMNDYAQEWAQHCAQQDQMTHREDKKYGENVCMQWSTDPQFDITGLEAVDQWYAELKDHVFGQEPAAGVLKSGHFSQLIWKGSSKLGIGKARSSSNRIYVVCNYDPAGNWAGQYAENVLPE